MRFSANFGPKFSKKFSRPQNFAVEIARDRAEIRCAPRAAGWPRPSEVPKHCAERRHAAAREIRCDSQRISDRHFRENFRGRKNPLCLTCCSLQRLIDRPRFVNCPQQCDSTTWRVRFGAILGEFRSEIFENFSRPQHFRVRRRAEIRCAPRAAACRS